MNDRILLALALITIDLIMIGASIVWLAYSIITHLQHRRRMRELDELASRKDFWGVMAWGEKYRKGKK